MKGGDDWDMSETQAANMETAILAKIQSGEFGQVLPWPAPTLKELSDPVFHAIKKAIEGWDIRSRNEYYGACNATDKHVMAIYAQVKKSLELI